MTVHLAAHCPKCGHAVGVKHCESPTCCWLQCPACSTVLDRGGHYYPREAGER